MTRDDLYIYAQELGATKEQAEAILDGNDPWICGCGDENGACYDDNKAIIEREVAALTDTDAVNELLQKDDRPSFQPSWAEIGTLAGIVVAIFILAVTL